MHKNLPATVKALPYILIIGGVIGLVCAFILTKDELKLAQNPNFVPSCNLNPIIACGSVMKSAQAHLFGFPNPWIGLAAFPVLITAGVALLASAKFKRWFWIAFEAAIAIVGVAFAYWLLYESVYAIKALCPYCLTVDIVVTVTFWYVTLHNFSMGHMRLPGGLKPVGTFMKRHHLDLLILWFLVVIFFILKHFWYYYGHYF